MPSKKKKYNARFPAGRIKKIMQSDEEIGKVAQAVPVIIYLFLLCVPRTLELFVESLLTKTLKITNSRNAKTLSTSHMKQCIMSEQRFDFLRELVKNIPDINVAEEGFNYIDDEVQSSPEGQYLDTDTPYDLSMPTTSSKANFICRSSSNTTATIQSNDIGSDYSRSQNVNNVFTSNNNTSNIGSSNIVNTNLKREHDVRQRLQHRIETRCGSLQTSVATTNSVIVHTAVLSHMNSEQMPAKLARSESTPAPTNHYKKQRRQSRGSSRVQPQIAKEEQHCNATITRNPAVKSNRSQSDTATPASIVSYELDKPIVKIDYSNLQIKASNIEDQITPLSSPPKINAASGGNCESAFHFSAEPVINIDLSNIVTDSNKLSPAIATVNFGALTPKQEVNSIPASHIKIITPLTPLIPLKPVATNAKDAFFELDEDYDNI